MGLFAHHPAAALHSSGHADPHQRDPSSLLSEDRPPALSMVAPASELAKIYSFMDEAQIRSRALESQVEQQKESNRLLLIRSSEELIALQTEMDQIAFENARMAQELAALTADNRIMLAMARGEIDGGESAPNALTTPATPAMRHTSLGSSRDSVSSASHYSNSPRFEGLTIASRPPSQQQHRTQA